MKRIKQTGLDQVGGKVYHLLKMQAAGLPVPDFAVFAFDFFQKSASSADLERMEAAYRAGIPVICVPDLKVPAQSFLTKAEQVFQDLDAVRDYLKRKKENQ